MMPTKDQTWELVRNTTYELITLNGLNCGKLTSKTDTSKYIFLPLVGEWYEEKPIYVDKYGYHWSASIAPSNTDYAYQLSITSNSATTGDNARYRGQPIRPIRLLEW